MLAQTILNWKQPVGSTIALHGPWGSGKSSAINLVRRELENSNERQQLVVTEFKSWWYRGEEALVLAFLQNLNAMLSDTLTKKTKNLIPDIGRSLLQASPIIGNALAYTSVGLPAPIVGQAGAFAARFFPKGRTVEKTFLKIAKILEQQDRRFLFIIDDIDRLDPDAALAIFRLVKSIGQLPNVMYLLVFDRMLAERTVAARFPSEGPHFLEKIIQAGFELPMPLQADINSALLHAIEQICGPINEDSMTRVMNLFYDCVAPYATTPRHVVRYRNAIAITWPAIRNEVNVADFIALEALRLYEPALFQAIRSHKDDVCGIRTESDPNHQDSKRFGKFLFGVNESHHARCETIMQRLFPRLEGVFYTNDSRSIWNLERRICMENHFETYFRLSLNDQTLSHTVIEQLLERADETGFVQKSLRSAVQVIRRNGQSMVPVYLDALTTHATLIDKEKVLPFMQAIFAIHDDIDLERDKDRGFNMIADTSLRYHWLIRRLTTDRFDLSERTILYLAALPKAQICWLVDFVSSACSQYVENEERPVVPENNLVSREALQGLSDLALSAIRTAAENGSLLEADDLLSILYQWRDFNDGDSSEPRAWTDSMLERNDALVTFARRLTGESWSLGLGTFGLGDRVSRREVRAQITDEMAILDVPRFREKIEALYEARVLDQDKQQDVGVFLEAWRRRRENPND